MNKVAFLLMSLTNSLLLGQATFDREVYEEKGHSLPYRILLPKDFEPTKKYPLLVFLHGAGERGSDNALQLTHGSSLFLAPSFREKQAAIVVFPQCPKDGYWATIISRDGPNRFVYSEKPKNNLQLVLVEGMIRSLKKKYRIDKRRIYLGGLSMGAMGTFELVYRNPRKFAAAFAICGGANPKIARKLRRPVWRIDHGEADQVVPIVFSENMVNALEENKAKVLFNRYPGVNHNSWDNVFADPSFLPWLFAQSK